MEYEEIKEKLEELAHTGEDYTYGLFEETLNGKSMSIRLTITRIKQTKLSLENSKNEKD